MRFTNDIALVMMGKPTTDGPREYVLEAWSDKGQGCNLDKELKIPLTETEEVKMILNIFLIFQLGSSRYWAQYLLVPNYIY